MDPRKKDKGIREEKKITRIFVGGTWYKNEPFILSSQAQQVYYLNDNKNGHNWKVVQKVCHRYLWDRVDNDVEDGQGTTELQEENSSTVRIAIEQNDLEMLLVSRNDIDPQTINTIDLNIGRPSLKNDNIMEDEIEYDDTLEEYNDDELLEEIESESGDEHVILSDTDNDY